MTRVKREYVAKEHEEDEKLGVSITMVETRSTAGAWWDYLRNDLFASSQER